MLPCRERERNQTAGQALTRKPGLTTAKLGNTMAIENSTAPIDHRVALDNIAEMALRIVDLMKAHPSRLSGDPMLEINVLARWIGLTADRTDPYAGADLNDVWGVMEA